VSLGEYLKDSEGNVTVDTVPNHVFKAITDRASSMVAAFSDQQEGSECVTHTLALVVNSVYKEDDVNPFLHNLNKKMRGHSLATLRGGLAVAECDHEAVRPIAPEAIIQGVYRTTPRLSRITSRVHVE